MKRKSNVYDNILSFDNAYLMYRTIRKNCKNKHEVFKFFINLNTNMYEILEKLRNESYVFGKYRIFLVKEPKYRLIMSENVADKLVNHLVAKFILLPVIEKSLIDSNVATRYGKGSMHAFNLFIKYINTLLYEKKEIFVLKIDVKKYFYNIDHELCMEKVRKKIKDKRAIKIVQDIIDTTNCDYINECINRVVSREINYVNSLNISEREKFVKLKELNKIPYYNVGKGLPIGNMTSQILAVFYLNDVDHFVKEKLGFKYYIRYMDDLVIVDTDKERLKKGLLLIEKEISKCKLEINDKTNIYRMNKGVSFVGYKFQVINNKLFIKYNFKTYRRIKRRLKNLRRFDFEKYLRSKGSYKGYLEKTTTKVKEVVMDL